MTTTTRRLAASFIAAATLLLSGCFVSPGNFTSAIDLRKDGRFSYAYNGEIYLLGLSKLAELGSKAKDAEPFKALPCYTDDAAADERECSKDELAKQKAEWEENRQADEAKNKRDAEMMKVMLGGSIPPAPRPPRNWPTACAARPGGNR